MAVVDREQNANPNPPPKFHINSHRDVLVEILKRLDGKSLGIAACVCKQWRSIVASDDAVWEHVCFRHASPPGTRSLVLALGGFKRLYLVCLRRFLRRPELTRCVWTSHGAQLLLSLFCVDYYENFAGTGGVSGGGSGGGGGGRMGSETTSSLMYLCKPVNV